MFLFHFELELYQYYKYFDIIFDLFAHNTAVSNIILLCSFLITHPVMIYFEWRAKKW